MKLKAKDIYRRKIKEIRFDLSRNYGFVMTYLQDFYAMSYEKPLEVVDQFFQIGPNNEGRVVYQSALRRRTLSSGRSEMINKFRPFS